MSKKAFLPRTAADQRTFLNRLDDNLPGVLATKYSIITAELTRLHEFRLWFNWSFDALDAIRQKAESFTGFRDDLAHGKSVPQGPLTPPPPLLLPAQPTTGTPPVAIVPLADGFGFVGSLGSRIKNHADYATADGDLLGLEGAEIAEPDPSTTKPLLKAILASGGLVEIQWKKSGFTGIRLEVDRGNGQFAFLDIDTKPHYTDPARPAAGATVLWKYRAIYLKGDQVFGQWSDVVSLAVTG